MADRFGISSGATLAACAVCAALASIAYAAGPGGDGAIDLSAYPTRSELDASVAAMRLSVPQPATASPPGVAADGVIGASSTQYARADHTHATSVQRANLIIAAAGQPVRWTFAKPYDTGAVPVVVCTARIASGSALPFTVNTVGAPTATYVDLVAYRVQSQVITLSALTAAATAGLSINPFSAAPSGTAVDCVAGKPTQ